MRRSEVLKPECFGRYSCKGGDCRYTCCSGWNISFSSNARKGLLKKSKDLCESIHLLDETDQNGENIYAISLDENGECPFLSDRRLCKIQQQYGAETMPPVCREFPHFYHHYLNKTELGLSLGCEKVLELLFEEKDGLRFINKMETIADNQRWVSNIDAKKRLKFPGLIYYYDIQSLCIGFLQAEDADIEDRIILLGMALFHIDTMVQEEKHQQIPAYINKFINDMEAINAAGQIKEITTEHLAVLCSNLFTLINFTSEVKIADTHIRKLATQITEKLKLENKTIDTEKEITLKDFTFNCSLETYRQCQKSFRTFMKDKEFFMENLAVAAFFHFNTPFHKPENGIWKDYTYFVWVLAMVKFAMTVVLDEKSTVEDMIDCCTIIFRMLGHNKKLYEHITNDLEANQSNSVAHMAVLLKSC